jgi:hypothetical protein
MERVTGPGKEELGGALGRKRETYLVLLGFLEIGRGLGGNKGDWIRFVVFLWL